MSDHNSSITRIVPTFNYVGCDISRLVAILRLFEKKLDYHKIEQENILESRYGSKSKGDPGEKQIPPVEKLLEWYILNNEKLDQMHNEKRQRNESYFLRKKLFEGDQEIRSLALRLLSKNYPNQRVWYVFEGYTCPDIYIETENYIFIGEAKRTEKHITSSTDWYKTRDQLIRHVDSVIGRDKKVVSFYIFDRDTYKDSNYSGYLNKYDDMNFLRQNLPHRNVSDIKKIMESYIGHIFWDDLSELFSISYPDMVKSN
jgi:hypothetical protein